MNRQNEMESKQQSYALWVDHIPGIGAEGKKKLVKYAGNPYRVYGLPENEIVNILGEKKAGYVKEARQRTDPELLLSSLLNKELHFYWWDFDGYPDKLRNIPNAPFGLYVYGKLPDKEKRAVAVIGARVCSGYGKEMAEEVGRELAKADVEVVSGMARGIDGFSQKAALSEGGKAYAVLGCGADICYPEQNRSLYDSLKRQGGIISEYLPGTQPRPQLFPVRNRIISGLSDAVLVIEAREKSGTLITVDMALEQGREVYVMPGRVSDTLSAGCNGLIKQGAEIVLSVQEFVAAAAQKPVRVQTKTECSQEPLLEALDYYPKSVDQIGEETSLPETEIMLRLMQLCIEGRARQISSFYFVKVPAPCQPGV